MRMRQGYKQGLLIAGVVVLCAAVLATALSELTVLTQTPVSAPRRLRVVVDAGHGAFDGGAIASDGTQEKDINLAVALPLESMLQLCGFEVTMVREEDTALHEDDNATIRQKKVSDMQNRLKLYEQADLNVSVHQNMFAAGASHGAQVFYSENHSLSKSLAQCIREEICRMLQPDNTRELKTGSRDIYLLYKAQKPTVLVECGFMSNAEELAKLKTAEYQRCMAFAIACGVTRYAADHAADPS